MPEGGTVDYSLMETQVKLKIHDDDDPFLDLEEVKNEDREQEVAKDLKVAKPALDDDAVPVQLCFLFEKNTMEGRETRGQIACDAGATMMLQYRSHLFTILICERFARFIRWDRSGAIVCKRFDYTNESSLIFDFYKRFTQLSPSQRGKDASVSAIADDDPDAIDAREKYGFYVADMWHGDGTAKPKREIDIADQKLCRMNLNFDGVPCRFVVCAPKFDDWALSPFGKCIRRSLALDLDLHNPRKIHGGLLFMKDYWGEDSPRIAKESDIYHRLAQHNVPHVAKMETGGDVPDMITITQQHARKLSSLPPGSKTSRLPALVAHRIFVRNIGRHLTTFLNAPAHSSTSFVARRPTPHTRILPYAIAHRRHTKLKARTLC
ncbi:hypothetical protein EV421DRAFT_1235454 [Armillaria borealis]|uniref:Fungal-type protein kinase domain-containing protein n=1 Tax=Armillaria borealis TaxID=47425 RepID=A0AA39J3G5_9AGAR|nr:hypothetical protein EV421DRAFT_1235454 [Armillaria borealis]